MPVKSYDKTFLKNGKIFAGYINRFQMIFHNLSGIVKKWVCSAYTLLSYKLKPSLLTPLHPYIIFEEIFE